MKTNRLQMIFAVVAAAGCDNYKITLTKTVELNTKLGNPSGGNSSKLFDVAIDTSRGKAYVHSILTSEIAVISTASGAVEKYVDSDLSGYHVSYMDVDTSTGRLFIADQASNKLVKINPTSGAIEATVTLDGGTPTKMAVDATHGYVFVAHAAKDEVRVYSTSSLSPVKTLGTAKKMYGPQGIKVQNGTVYIALSRDQETRYGSDVAASSTRSAVAIVNPSTWAVSTVSCAYQGAEEVAVDSANGRYWLLSSGRLRYCSAAGAHAQRTFSEEAKEIDYSDALGKPILLTRDGADSVLRAAPYGTLEVLAPETLETETKWRLGMKPSRMAVDEAARKVYAANMADGTVSVVDFSSLVPSSKTSTTPSISTTAVAAPIASVGTSSTTGSTTSSAAPSIVTSTPIVNTSLDIESLQRALDDAQYRSVSNSVDVGASIEDLVVHPDGGRVYLMSRLGGSNVYLYNKATGAVTAIAVSPWPTRLQIDGARRELYVLSHFASAVDVIDIDTNEVVATIDMTTAAVDQNRTHYISDMAYDKSRGRLYAAFPEQGKIVEVNVATRAVTQVVSAFTPVTDGEDETDGTEVGRAQLAVDSKSSRVFVYYRDERRLDVLNPYSALAVVQTFSFSSSEWDGNGYEAHLLTVDEANQLLFVGPRVYAVSGGRLTYKTEISSIHKVIGVSSGYLAGATASTDKSVALYLFKMNSSSSFSYEGKETLEPTNFIPPRFAADTTGDTLFVAYPDVARLLVYDVDQRSCASTF